MSEKREDKTNQAIMESIGCEGKSKSDDDEEKELTLPGFRFHPTDEELVGFYLTRKVQNKRIKIDLIKEVDIYKHDPWDLPKLMSKVGDSKEWYFFSMRGRKYKNSVRPNRVTGSGFWKATGIDKPVYSQSTNECIGLKKSLVYYRGSAGKGTKTDWMMHEFRLPPIWKATSNGQQLPTPKNIIIPEAEVWTLCRIFRRISNYKRFTSDWKQQQQPVVKQSFGDASSKACSLQSEISDDHSNNVINFKKMEFPQKNSITASSGGNLNYQVDQRNSNYYYNNSQPITTVPQSSFTSSSNSSFWNTSTAEDQEYLFSDGNWDELKSVVDLAIDPRSLFGFK